MKWKKLVFISLTCLVSTKIMAEKITITGAGATFPAPLYSRWAQQYANVSDVQINYQPIGSGGGIKQILAGTVDFGASDKPLTQHELTTHKLVQFPTVLGAIVPVINLPTIKPNTLKLTGPVLADIFQGKIKQWSDPKITSLNPELDLPNKPITVIHRSDGSGTTFLFTNYLSKVSPEWAQHIGYDVSVKWPRGVGGKGNEGVALYVKQIEGSIGYVEYSYAATNKLAHVQLQNKDNHFVQPTAEGVKSAAQFAQWSNPATLLTDMPGIESWPITGTTYILMPATPKKSNEAKTKSVLKFFAWAYEQGQNDARTLEYVPLPPEVIIQVKQQWKNQFKDESEKLIWSE